MTEICKCCSHVQPVFADVESCLDAIEEAGHEDTQLFRGEACLYPSTSPGTRRVLEDSALQFEQKSFLIDAACMFQEWYEENMPEALNDCDMFLQHYGLPTDLLDFTESPQIAAYFASKDLPSHVGRIGVLALATAQSEGLDVVRLQDFKIDGTNLLRPEKQRAWAVRHQPGVPSDFQDPTVCKQLGLRWFTFHKQMRHSQLFAGLDDILDSSGDRCAILMRQWLAEFTELTWHRREFTAPLVERVERYL